MSPLGKGSLVIHFIFELAKKRCEASEYFGISRNTIDQWLQLQAETGDVHPKPTAHHGHSHKITN